MKNQAKTLVMQPEEEGVMTVMEAPFETLIETQPELRAEPELAERIRLRAYELYEARNGEGNHASEDWVQAEAEILGAHL